MPTSSSTAPPGSGSPGSGRGALTSGRMRPATARPSLTRRHKLGGVVLKLLVEVGRLGVAGVDDDAVAERDRLAWLDSEVAGALLHVLVEVVQAKDVRREQPVLPRVPRGRHARVRRVVDDRPAVR